MILPCESIFSPLLPAVLCFLVLYDYTVCQASLQQEKLLKVRDDSITKHLAWLPGQSGLNKYWWKC